MRGDPSFYLKIAYSMPLFDADLDDWARPFTGRITAIQGDLEIVPVGRITGWIVPMHLGRRTAHLITAADACEAECLAQVNAVIDFDTNDYREELGLADGGNGILAIEDILLRPPYRGYNLGRVALWYVLQTLGQGRTVAVLHPPTLAPAGEEGREPRPLRGRALGKRRRQLSRYWGRLGFRPVPGYPDFYYADLSQVPEIAPVLRPRRGQEGEDT